jgi:type I restriction-modification system DNA methylase subunit
MSEYDKVRKGLETLIEKRRTLKAEVGEQAFKEIKEANVRKDFIDPLFKILGWKVDDLREYDAENYIRDRGYVDVVLKIGGKPVVFVEAKRFGGIPACSERGVQLTLLGRKVNGDWSAEERQVLNYADMSVDVKWAVLTNFERFRLFNAKTGSTILDIEVPEEYIERLDDMMLLTKTQVEVGNINKLESRIERPDVDQDFLELLNEWRLRLARAIVASNPGINLEEVKQDVQRILDRLVIIRYAEDRWVLDTPDQLKAAYDYWQRTKSYTSLTKVLKDLFTGFKTIHDSKIFEPDPELDRVLGQIGDAVIGEIITQLYAISFRKFTSDILGTTYESYLGHELYRNNGQVDLRLNPKLQQAGGITYTRPFVVDFITKHTVGEELTRLVDSAKRLLEEGKSDEAFAELRSFSPDIVDPACGSGSFLIRTFGVIKGFFDQYNELVAKANEEMLERILELRRQGKGKEAWNLQANRVDELVNYEKTVLDMLYGVDKDPQAAELTSVNLIMHGLKRGEKLPLILDANVMVGNSIIDSTPEELQRDFGTTISEKQPFQWRVRFGDVFGDGFSYVLGNPPYNNMRDPELANEQTYCEEYYPDVYRGNTDILYYFVAKGLDLLRPGGVLGFIVARYFMNSAGADKFRDYILRHAKIRYLIDTRNFQCFEGRNVLTCIIVLTKTGETETPKDNLIKVVSVKSWEDDGSRLFRHIDEHLSEESYSDKFIDVFRVNQNRLGSRPWSLQRGDVDSVLAKVESESWLLHDVLDVGVGFETGLNKAKVDSDIDNPSATKQGVFLVTGKEAKGLRLEKEALVKVVEPNEIQRYRIDYGGSFLVNTSRVTDIDSLPFTKDHLSRFRKQLEKRNAMPACKWFGISHRKNEEFFTKRPTKIMVPAYATSNRFAMDDGNGFYCINTAYVIVPKDQPTVDLWYALAVLNSKLIEFYHKRKLSKLKREGYYEYFAEQLRLIPIHKVRAESTLELTTQDRLVELAKEMSNLAVRKASIVTDFDRYIAEPVKAYTRIRKYYEKVPANRKEVFDRSGKGRITRLFVEEDEESLTFKIDGKTKKGQEVHNYPVFRCAFESRPLRTLIVHNCISLRKFKAGNFFESILEVELPLFAYDEHDSMEILGRQMEHFDKDMTELEDIADKIKLTDDEMNRIVYSLYGLTPDEVNLVEDFFAKPY